MTTTDQAPDPRKRARTLLLVSVWLGVGVVATMLVALANLLTDGPRLDARSPLLWVGMVLAVSQTVVSTVANVLSQRAAAPPPEALPPTEEPPSPAIRPERVPELAAKTIRVVSSVRYDHLLKHEGT